jgi:hypothetical protein
MLGEALGESLALGVALSEGGELGRGDTLGVAVGGGEGLQSTFATSSSGGNNQG